MTSKEVWLWHKMEPHTIVRGYRDVWRTSFWKYVTSPKQDIIPNNSSEKGVRTLSLALGKSGLWSVLRLKAV
ncbi:hypothetical protein NPIL_523881, partial [Nephila pilipes]